MFCLEPTPCKLRSIYAMDNASSMVVEGKARQLEGFYRWLEAKRAKGDTPC